MSGTGANDADGNRAGPAKRGPEPRRDRRIPPRRRGGAPRGERPSEGRAMPRRRGGRCPRGRGRLAPLGAPLPLCARGAPLVGGDRKKEGEPGALQTTRAETLARALRYCAHRLSVIPGRRAAPGPESISPSSRKLACSRRSLLHRSRRFVVMDSGPRSLRSLGRNDGGETANERSKAARSRARYWNARIPFLFSGAGTPRTVIATPCAL